MSQRSNVLTLFVIIGVMPSALGSCAEVIEGCSYTGTCPTGGNLGAGGTSASGGTPSAGGAGGDASGGTSVTAGAPTDGGAGGSAPCDGTCTGLTPVCDVESMTCVGCVAHTDCADPTPVCDPTAHTCVGCLAKTDCKAPTPVCDAGTNTCVGCIAPSDCGGQTPFCDAVTQTCVACLGPTDCTDPAAAQCSPTHTCKPCTNSTQCANIADKPICSIGTCVQCAKQSDCTDPAASQCDMTKHTCTACATDAHCSNIAGKGVCLSGACVQCTAAKPAACGTDAATSTPFVCDSLKHTCTTQKAASAGLCAPCVSDAQCKPGELCVLDTVGTGTAAKTVGYFCHWKKGDTANGAPADCFASGRPYAGTLTGVTSIDDEKSDICSLRVSSCVANAQFSSKNCAPTGAPEDAQCGVSAPIDAKCIQVTASSAYRCTMTCLSDEDCRNGSPCNADVSPPVCQF